MALADQVPVTSGFPAKSTGAAVLASSELAGKVAIVTGGYSGIGAQRHRLCETRAPVRVMLLACY